MSKALNTSGGGGRYSCDECGKLFKHPGSLQHHRHIHRGTHKCPSCGKVNTSLVPPIYLSMKFFTLRLSPAAGTWRGTSTKASMAAPQTGLVTAWRAGPRLSRAPEATLEPWWPPWPRWRPLMEDRCLRWPRMASHWPLYLTLTLPWSLCYQATSMELRIRYKPVLLHHAITLYCIWKIKYHRWDVRRNLILHHPDD